MQSNGVSKRVRAASPQSTVTFSCGNFSRAIRAISGAISMAVTLAAPRFR